MFALGGAPLLICPGSNPPEHAVFDLVVFKVAYSAYDPQVASAVRSVASGWCLIRLSSYPKTDNIARTFLINIPNKDNFFKKIVFLRDYDTR